jgi:hypothetical protein
MTTAAPSTALATIQPAFTDAERLALAGFLAGYRGLTREAYALDLRRFTTWCRARSLALFAVRRADIEGSARDLEARGWARATVTRRLCTIAGFYRYAVEEELLDHSPAAQVRRPRVNYESHAVALDRNELGALLVAAGLGPPTEHALISLLALNGASGIRGDRGRYRASGPRTQAPDPDHHPERRQGGDCPAGTAHGPSDRPGRRRAHRLACVPGRGRATAGPARRRQGRPPSGHRLEQLCQAVTAAGQSSRCRRSDRSPSVTHRDPTADAIRLTHVGRIPTRALAFRTGHSALARDGR